jgi:hypothetical protein
MTSYADFLSRKVLEAPLRGLDDTRCAVVIPAEADYYRFDLGDVAQRVCLGCFVELGGKDGN